MKIEEAKSKLFDELKNNPNFVGVGLQDNVIMVYLAKQVDNIPSLYEGFTVKLEITGHIQLQ